MDNDRFQTAASVLEDILLVTKIERGASPTETGTAIWLVDEFFLPDIEKVPDICFKTVVIFDKFLADDVFSEGDIVLPTCSCVGCCQQRHQDRNKEHFGQTAMHDHGWGAVSEY